MQKKFQSVLFKMAFFITCDLKQRSKGKKREGESVSLFWGKRRNKTNTEQIYSRRNSGSCDPARRNSAEIQLRLRQTRGYVVSDVTDASFRNLVVLISRLRRRSAAKAKRG